MTGISISSDGLPPRRKRLLYRCWHRGIREMDLLLGTFAEQNIASLTDDEIAELEQLSEIPDQALYAALTGNAPRPDDCPEAMFERLKAFQLSADRRA